MQSDFHLHIGKLFLALGVLLVHCGSLHAAEFDTRKGPGGTVDYFFPNVLICHKRADYVKSNQAKAELSALFRGIGAKLGLEYQDKWRQIRRLNPTYEMISALIFDICFECGVGRLNKQQYLQRRDYYWKIRDDLLFGQAVSPEDLAPTVLLMDSPVDKVVYNPNLRGTGATNADEITEILDDLPIFLPVEKTRLRWNRVAQVHKLNPTLVVIHFSAFESDTVDCAVGPEQTECNNRLRYFLRSLQALDTKVLLYSRKPGFSSPAFKERFLDWLDVPDPSFRGRFTLFGMTDNKRNPRFDDPDTAIAFKEVVVKVLGVNILSRLPNRLTEPTR